MSPFRTVAVVLLLAVAACGAVGQTRPRRVDPAPAPASQRPASAEPSASDDEPLSLEGALVEVPVVVSDRSGRYVPNLRQQDFKLVEDGKPQTISFFRSDRLPIHVALLLDTSMSTRLVLSDIQEAAVDFINQLLPGDQIMIVTFAADVTIEQEFTSDRRVLTDAVRRVTPTRGTRLYEAVYDTVSERLKTVDGRKAIVILSDGQDVGSAVSADRATGVCSESDVTVYGIRYPRAADLIRDRDPSERRGPGRRGRFPRGGGFPGADFPFASSMREPSQVWGGGGGGGRRRGNDPFMDTVTANSGGAIYAANAIGDIGDLFRKIAEELRHVYVLGYEPANDLSNGGYRAIDVSVPARPELAVRHRLGYQAGATP